MQSVRIEVESHGSGARIVSLFGEHDLQTSGELRERLEEGEGDVVVDLSAAEFVDSSILGVLVSAAREAESAGRGFALCVPDDAALPVRRVLEVTGLDERLSVQRSRELALASLGGS